MNRSARSLDPGGSVCRSRSVAGPTPDNQGDGGAPRIGITFGLGEAFAGWRQIARLLIRAGEAAASSTVNPRVDTPDALSQLRHDAASPADAVAEVAHDAT